MPIPGIEFRVQRPNAAPASTRADVAMFAGLVGRRDAPLPAQLLSNLADAGWREGGSFPVSDGRLTALLGVPVPVESWAEFDSLFDWNSRVPIAGSEARLPCPLGLAVRQFFLQGGARAWIVRCGDPLPLADPTLGDDKFADLQLTSLAGPTPAGADAQPILPGLDGRSPRPDPLDIATWQGAALIFSVEDAAMLLLPDLTDLCAGPAEIMAPPPEPPGPPEQFLPCVAAVADPAPAGREPRPQYRAPRLGQSGYRQWSSALTYTLEMLGRPRGPEHRRDVMLVAALPIPGAGLQMPTGSEQWPLYLLCDDNNAGTDKVRLAPFDADSIGNARLQLSYPWISTPDSAMCPEGLQSAEGSLAGLIARSALEGGAFRSAAGRTLSSPALLFPNLSTSNVARGLAGKADWLGDRLCIFAERRSRIELVSDSTAASDRAWRKGGVSRLIGILLRACRHLGEGLVFEPSGPALWTLLKAQVTAILEELRALGAFDGLTPGDCYQVTCDRSVMTQADVDAGRVRCEVIVNPASPIERIVVILSLLDPVPSLAKEAA